MSMLEVVNLVALSIVGVLAFLGILMSYRRNHKAGQSIREWSINWFADFSTEMAGAFLTAILFGLLVGLVQESQEQAALRESLIRRLGSPYGTTALDASRELISLGWLYDGSLRGSVLTEAHLSYSTLENADLSGTSLWNAKLDGARLVNARLDGSYLVLANLKNAFLQHASLVNVDMAQSNLEGASLQGANFTGANLVSVILVNAAFDNQTIMPNGEYWRPNSDIEMYTNPQHPQFWRSIDEQSPAFRG